MTTFFGDYLIELKLIRISEFLERKILGANQLLYGLGTAYRQPGIPEKY